MDGKIAFDRQPYILLIAGTWQSLEILTPRKIRVNSVSPGPVETPLYKDMITEQSFRYLNC